MCVSSACMLAEKLLSLCYIDDTGCPKKLYLVHVGTVEELLIQWIHFLHSNIGQVSKKVSKYKFATNKKKITMVKRKGKSK